MPALIHTHGDQAVMHRIPPARTRRASRHDERAAASDDESAYTVFFRDHFANVTRTIHLIVRDRARAEDVTQDAFLQLYRNWSRVSEYERPDAWVRRVAIRLAVRGLRRDSLWNSVRGLFVQREFERAVDLEVADAIGRLPRNQRVAIVLHYFEDRPVAEIAQLLACSEPTARVHLHRGRRRLAELLREGVGDVAGR